MKLQSRTRLRLGAVTAALAALGGLSPSAARAQEGGIEVFAGNTLFEEGMRVSLTHIYKRKGRLIEGEGEVSDPEDRVVQEQRAVLGIDYGIYSELTLSALVPAVYIEERRRAPGVPKRREAFGPGDTAFLAKYRFFKLDWPRSSLNLAVIGGVETPTGETGARDGGIRLPPSLQPGSGSWDPFAATSATVSLDRFRFDAIAFYKVNTEGSQDFAAGNFFVFETDVAYRFLYTKYPGPTASVRTGVQFRNEEPAEEDGRRLPNSGGREVRVRFALGFHPRPNIDLSLSVEVPVYQRARGRQLAREVRTFAGFGVRF